MVVTSPCVKLCKLDDNSMCIGCNRSIGEIREWSIASEQRRRDILKELKERK